MYNITMHTGTASEKTLDVFVLLGSFSLFSTCYCDPITSDLGSGYVIDPWFHIGTATLSLSTTGSVSRELI